MADEANNRVLELLRANRADLSDVKSRVELIEVRLSAIEGHLANVMPSVAGQNSEIDAIKRLERVERRLELVDEA